jgi:predicted nucleic acid-binding protein
MRKLWLPIPNRVFIDTSAYFALYSADDSDHARAVAIGSSARFRVYSSNYVVAETHALLLRRHGRKIAAIFLEETLTGGTVYLRVGTKIDEAAREIILTQDDKDYSLTDATSFVLMEHHRIGVAFTFDRHFAQYGFAVLGLEDQ